MTNLATSESGVRNERATSPSAHSVLPLPPQIARHFRDPLRLAPIAEFEFSQELAKERNRIRAESFLRYHLRHLLIHAALLLDRMEAALRK
jgi:hypothetical protein